MSTPITLPQRALGKSAPSVSAIGLGGMPLSIKGRPPEEMGIRVIHTALDFGVTLIDTADAYCLDDSDTGHNERLIHKALASWHGDARTVTVATKGGLTRPQGEWVRDGRPSHLRAACERSLKSLGTESIALYQLHAPDPKVRFEDSVGELSRLQEEGKIQHIGLSNVSVAHIAIAQEIVTVVSVQNRCNPHDLRAVEEGVLGRCEADGITFLPWSPVGGGSGKTSLGEDPTLVSLGERYQATPYEVALSWLLAISPAMIPIPGASKEESIRSSVRALRLALSQEDVFELNQAFGFSRPEVTQSTI
ncbi:MAG: aldo/keto reductase [Myxococcales bacterium]|nr:aldo/keto reductase [Myxococcales bacterium]